MPHPEFSYKNDAIWAIPSSTATTHWFWNRQTQEETDDITKYAFKVTRCFSAVF